MSDFFRTIMGRTFFESTMPRIAKALEQIAAALERQSPATVSGPASSAGDRRRPNLRGADDAFASFRAKLPASLEQEIFVAAMINAHGDMIGEVIEVAKGTVDGVDVHPRDVFREAIRANARGVVVAHNHPSGDPTPSTQDIELTKRLRAIGEIVGIGVVDHLVVAGDRYRSIAEYMGTEF